MQFGNVIFITWRESVEALLVVGILNAWLSHQTDPIVARRGRLFLWSGVACGLLVAVLFGALLTGFGSTLSEGTQKTYQTAAVLLAAALIVQMVFWMRKHGRTLKRELQTSLDRAAANANWWGVFVLSMIAVAREGSETVVFLYGTIAAAQQSSAVVFALAALAGFGLSVGTYLLLQAGSRVFSWRLFFRVTEVMLLFLGASLLVTGVENLMDLEVIPQLSGRLWDSSAWLPDSGVFGGLFSALTGYRAQPDLTQLLAFALYWTLIAWFLWRPKRPPIKAAA